MWRRHDGWWKRWRTVRLGARRGSIRPIGESSSRTPLTLGCEIEQGRDLSPGVPSRMSAMCWGGFSVSLRSLLVSAADCRVSSPTPPTCHTQARSATQEGHLPVVRALYRQCVESAKAADPGCPLRNASEALLLEVRARARVGNPTCTSRVWSAGCRSKQACESRAVKLPLQWKRGCCLFCPCAPCTLLTLCVLLSPPQEHSATWSLHPEESRREIEQVIQSERPSTHSAAEARAVCRSRQLHPRRLKIGRQQHFTDSRLATFARSSLGPPGVPLTWHPPVGSCSPPRQLAARGRRKTAQCGQWGPRSHPEQSGWCRRRASSPERGCRLRPSP